jgi:Circularly permutated YpsA SLOG family
MTQPGDAIGAEPGLRRSVRAAAGLTIVTGGQTGVDSYAAHAALRAGLPVHVVFPAGLRQEDGPLTTARRRQLAGARLHELGAGGFEYRTWTCVNISDAVLLLDPAGGAGCQETARAARSLGRPLLAPAPGELTAAGAAHWLADTAARVVLVAGCRASLLTRHDAAGPARAGIAAFTAAARQRQRALLAAP